MAGVAKGGEKRGVVAAAALPRPPLAVRVRGFADTVAEVPAGGDGPVAAAAAIAVVAAAAVVGDGCGCLFLSRESCLVMVTPEAVRPSSCRRHSEKREDNATIFRDIKLCSVLYCE